MPSARRGRDSIGFSSNHMKSFLTVFGILLFANIFALSAAFVPQVAFSAPEIVPAECAGPAGECGWEELVKLGSNIMRFGIYLLSILSVIGIVYAGWLYISSEGSDGKISKAHDVFTKIVWGIFFTLAAWLIVNSVLTWLGVSEDFTLLRS